MPEGRDVLVNRMEERKAKNSVFQCRGNIDNNHLRVKFGVKVELSFGANKSAYCRGMGDPVWTHFLHFWFPIT